jgi:hypothetical protein
MVSRNRTGIVAAALVGGWHVVWSGLVLSGLGQILYDFILWAHMIHLEIVIGPFELIASIALIIFTSLMGYVIGFMGAWAWNRVYP